MSGCNNVEWSNIDSINVDLVSKLKQYGLQLTQISSYHCSCLWFLHTVPNLCADDTNVDIADIDIVVTQKVDIRGPP